MVRRFLAVGAIVSAALLPASPSSAQLYMGNPDHSYCLMPETAPHLETLQIVYNQLFNFCSEALNVFYCFPKFSTNGAEVCGRTQPFSIPLAGGSTIRIGLAPADYDNKPVMIGCMAPSQVFYDGRQLGCR